MTFNWIKPENAVAMGKNIIKLVVGLGQGIGQTLVISPDRAYVRPANNAFQIDNSNLNNDARRIGKDLKNKLKQYSHGESSYQR